MRTGSLPLTLIGVICAAASSCAGNPQNPTSINPVTPTAVSTPGDPPLLNLAATYLFTVTASPSCTAVRDRITGEITPLPDSARLRQYDAAVAQHGNAVDIMLSGSQFAFPELLRGALSGDQLNIIEPLLVFTCSDYWAETIGPQDGFAACGDWTATVADASHIVGTLNGTIEYWRAVDSTPTGVRSDLQCEATDHLFSMIKN